MRQVLTTVAKGGFRSDRKPLMLETTTEAVLEQHLDGTLPNHLIMILVLRLAGYKVLRVIQRGRVRAGCKGWV